VKLPTPEPSVVLEFDVVGSVDVFQHTPLSVTLAPPSAVTFPPLLADNLPILEISVVVTVGADVDIPKISITDPTQSPDDASNVVVSIKFVPNMLYLFFSKLCFVVY
jgi:hypothetical protein